MASSRRCPGPAELRSGASAAGVGGLLVAVALLAGLPAPGEAQTMRTVTKVRSVTDEKNLEVNVVYGAGTLEIGAGDPDVLYRARIRYDEEVFEPVTESREGHLRLGVRSHRDFSLSGLRSHSNGEFDLELAPGLPLDLELEFGAVDAEIDLGGLSITGLEVATGASQTELDFSSPNPVEARTVRIALGAAALTATDLGNLNARRIEVKGGVGDVALGFGGEWRRNAEVGVEMGLGSVRLEFPEELGVRIRKETFLTSFDPEGLTKRGDTYTSPNWDDAERRVTVEVTGALGAVNVRWMR